MKCNLCSADEFKCSSDGCIPLSWRCDGKIDCITGVDEENCTNTLGNASNVSGTLSNVSGIPSNVTNTILARHHPLCTGHVFKCKNNECADWDRVCNGLQDGCSDGSDEGEKCETSCKNSLCQQRCIRSPNGAVCACNEGYTLNSDGTTCDDINECNSSHFPCSQNCGNTNGSYRCSCFSGFALSRDKTTCKSIDAQMFMFYSAYDTIYRLGPHLTKLKSANGLKILSFDMNFDKKLLYFGIEDSDTLYEMDWTEKGQTKMIKNIGTPSQIAVDWVTDNVYFVDETMAIKVCHMENKNCVTLLELKRDEHIKSLIVDAVNRRLFYVTTKKFEFNMPECKIYGHNLDGSQRHLVTNDSFFVPAIACDIYTERLYYLGLESKSIWSVKYDGTGKQMIIANSEYISRPIGINILEGHAFVLNSGSNIVAKCRLFGDKQCNAFPLNVKQPTNLVIAQKSRQKSITNVCATNKCDTICTPSDLGAKCICDLGQMIEEGDVCSLVVSETF